MHAIGYKRRYLFILLVLFVGGVVYRVRSSLPGPIEETKPNFTPKSTFVDHLYRNPRIKEQINQFCGYLCKDKYDQYLNHSIMYSQQASYKETIVEIRPKSLYESSFSGWTAYTFKSENINGKSVVSLRNRDECLENCPLQAGTPHEVTEYIISKYGDLHTISGRVGFSESFYQGNYYIARATFVPEDYMFGTALSNDAQQLFIGYWSGGRHDLYQGSSGEISCEALEQVGYPSALLNQYSITCTPGADRSIPLATKDLLGLPYIIPSFSGQVVPSGQNIQDFVIALLKERGILNYTVEKQERKGTIATLSLKDSTEYGCHFEGGGCIVFIFKDNTLIRSNLSDYLACSLSHKDCHGGNGRFYRYTDHGVLLEIQNGEGFGCSDFKTYTFHYIDFNSLNDLRSTLTIIQKGTPKDPNDELCEGPNISWTKAETLRFFTSFADTRHTERALTIQANSTEEAFDLIAQ